MARAMDFDQALKAVASGDRVFVTHPDPDKPKQRMSVATLGGEKPITRTASARLAPLMTPVEDRLFQGVSQSFALDRSKLEKGAGA